MRKTLLLLLTVLLIPAATAAAKPATVKVMSRNLYLGADLTPGVKAQSLQGLVDAAGQILNTVDQNNFPARAKGVANEIAATKPDLVGLQEAALWRTEPCDKNPIPPAATTVRYDYIQLILNALAKRGLHYRVAVAKPEFDFEVWANTDGNEQTSGPNCPLGSEINGRLTMRDAILVRRGIKVSNARSATYPTLLRVKPAGVNVDVTRGWTAVDAIVGGHKFDFVNTHLEAFDNNAQNTTNQGTTVGNGQIRAQQAAELLDSKTAGFASKRMPVILVGDLNSDVETAIKPGDGLADARMLKAGLVERSTTKPLGCCLNADVLTKSGGGKRSDFDHKVDHVMTNAPKKVTLVKGVVTGLLPFGNYWASDHAGLVSTLLLR